jgi:glycosyltransferase involved in cell wall biosynthesis
MKVLHIYAGNLFGGIETFLITLAKGQNLCPQMESHFAVCFEGRLSQELRKNSVTVHFLGNVKVSQIWTVWRAQQQLKKLINQEKFDVVICHACWSQAIFGGVVKKPLVFWCHDAILGKHWLERWARLIKPSLAIANSQHTLTFLQNFYPHIPTPILSYPVYASEVENTRNQTRQNLNTDLEKIVIIQVSRLERWKGHALLLSALGKLKDLATWECWIVGGVQRQHEEIYLQELQDQIQSLGISNQVKFLGQRSDVPNLLRSADIHCQPNIGAEPFGITFIEALYAGLPVVTTNMGGGSEIVDSTCGILVEPSNILELSEALRSLINNKSQRQELGSHGYARAKQLCDPAQQINQLHHILQELVN